MSAKKNPLNSNEENMNTEENPENQGNFKHNVSEDGTIVTGTPPRTERESDMIVPGEEAKPEDHEEMPEDHESDVPELERDNENRGKMELTEDGKVRERSDGLYADTPGINEGDAKKGLDGDKEEEEEEDPLKEFEATDEDLKDGFESVSKEEFDALPENEKFEKRKHLMYENQHEDFVDFGLLDEAESRWNLEDRDLVKVRFYNDKVIAVTKAGRKLVFRNK